MISIEQIKTLINGFMQSIGDVKRMIVKPDWLVNDANDPSYIKNRPFYRDGIITKKLDVAFIPTLEKIALLGDDGRRYNLHVDYEGSLLAVEEGMTGIHVMSYADSVLEGTTLEKLTEDLHVEAEFKDGHTSSITGYALRNLSHPEANCIVADENYIEVCYKGFTTTFSVWGTRRCTGITFSTNELDLSTPDTTEYLRFSVTPEDCGEEIICSSSNPTVANVYATSDSCVVEPLTNGTTVITIQCGNYSASCIVKVTAFAEGLLEGVEWHTGTILTIDGTIDASVTDSRYTDAFDVSAYQKGMFVAKCTAGQWQSCHLAFYDKNHKILRISRFVSDMSAKSYLPDGAVYCRVSLSQASGNRLVLTGSEENLWESLEVQEGAYLNGVYDPDKTDSCHIRVPYDISKGTDLWFTHASSYTCLDEDDTVLRYSNCTVTHALPLNASVIATGTKVVAINTEDSYVTGGKVRCAYLRQIGSSTVPG